MDGNILASTNITPHTRSESLPEVLQQHSAPAAPPLHVAAHGGSHAPGEVPRPPQEDALGGGSVAPGAPRFLVIALEGARGPPVDHAPYIRLVDAHAKGAGRDGDGRL